MSKSQRQQSDLTPETAAVLVDIAACTRPIRSRELGRPNASVRLNHLLKLGMVSYSNVHATWLITRAGFYDELPRHVSPEQHDELAAAWEAALPLPECSCDVCRSVAA